MKLALWQTQGCPADKAANLAALDQMASAAAAAGAALLLCPECWLCGYNIGSAVAALAEERGGPSARRIGEVARAHHLAIAYGYAEREGSNLFNAVQVMGSQGTPIAHYRKVHLFGADERAAYRPGERFEAPFELDGIRLGLLICYDVEFPEAVRSLKLLGAQAILVPTALTDEYGVVPRLIVPARSIESQVFVAYCNHAGTENGMRFLGGSCLTGLDGEVVVAAGRTDALIVGEIDLSGGEAAARVFPYLKDRRPDLYRPVSQPRS
jgi:nitrilase